MNIQFHIKALLLIMVALIGYIPNISGQPVLIDKISAVVGDKVILYSDVEIQFLQYQQQGEVPEDLRCQIIEQMLVQRMMLTQAEADSIVVGEDEVEGELERRLRYFTSLFGSEQELENYYGKSVLEIKE